MGTAPGPVPDWLPELAEAVAGYHVAESKNLESIISESNSRLLALRSRFRSDSEEPQDSYTRWARWFFSDRDQRSVSPTSSIDVQAHLRRVAQMDSPELRVSSEASHLTPQADLLQHAPMEPRYLARLGHKLVAHSQRNLPPELARADWLTRPAVELDPAMA